MGKGTTNQAIATGRVYVDYDPLRHLKHLQAQIGYRGGYCIYLSLDAMQRLEDVIAFNEGREPANYRKQPGQSPE